MNRRQFLKNSFSVVAAAAAFPTIVPASVWGKSIKPSDRITLGFIGLGKQGTYLLQGFLNMPAAQVLAVCDVDKLKLKRAKEIADNFYAEKTSAGNYRSCADYIDFWEIINRSDIDAFVFATPDHWHAIQTIAAARAGKDIYGEKPLSLTIAEARIMVNEVRRNSCVFQTGSMQRSDSRFRFACELVRNGYIGEIKTVRVSIATGFQPHPVICDLPAQPVPPELDWERWLGPAPQRPFNAILAPPISFDGFPAWRDYIDYSGGGMTDWGAHHFDIAQWGLGMDNSGPVEIFPADGKNFELLTYRYSNGVLLTTDFIGNGILFTGNEGEIEVNRSLLRTTPEKLLSQIIKPEEIHLYRSDEHKADWLHCVRSRSKPICDVEIGCRSVTVCHLGNLATQLKRPLKWDPQQELFIDDEAANRLLSRSKRSSWQI